jgi:hypothetical protein
MRVAFAVTGLCALIPAGAFAQAIWTDIAGVLLGGMLLVREIMATRGSTAKKQAATSGNVE